ncbi:MAG: DAK2 domain-containing protein [Clostridia bacterium]|nr:DAK2 domain-containing protein [Clostridia bacterium]
MSTTILDGKALKSMLIGGTEFIKTNSAQINDLNVFPVPDGDTGTNMTKTLEGGITHILPESTDSVAAVMEKFADGLLLGARGNSGVILSQIFSGIKDGLSKLDTVTAQELSEAYKSGISKSYAAVSNPTEGTILTVFRESAEYAAKHITQASSIEDFYQLHIEEAKRSLARTKELLPVLAEADVVDSGAAGYLCIAIGMYSVLTGKYNADLYTFTEATAQSALDLNCFTRDSKLVYGYCTELLLRLTTAKCVPEDFSTDHFVQSMKDLGGESIVAYREGDIVKLHVHTMTPGKVLEEAQTYGEFLTVKIENMELGHSEPEKVKKSNKRKKFATVAVATGDGICALFGSMGADAIVSGGQTDNPSTEEFIHAFEQVNADAIIVLPNNKNVMLAAEQAAELYRDSEIHIVPTYSLMEGYGALSVITPGVSDVKSLVAGATRAAKGVLGAEITRAVRNVTIGGKVVTKGDYIAIAGGEIAAVGADRDEVLLQMLASADMDEYEIITLFMGADVDDAARVAITERLEEEYPAHEIIVHVGGQELYDYLIAIE